MELDQLFQNASVVENRHPDFHPFDLGILREAFKMRETTHADLSYAVKGTGRKMFELNGNSVDNKKHEKHKIRDKDKHKNHTRRHHQKDSGTRKDGEKTSKGRHDVDPNNLPKLPDKKGKFEGVIFPISRDARRLSWRTWKVKIVGASRMAHWNLNFFMTIHSRD